MTRGHRLIDGARAGHCLGRVHWRRFGESAQAQELFTAPERGRWGVWWPPRRSR